MQKTKDIEKTEEIIVTEAMVERMSAILSSSFSHEFERPVWNPIPCDVSRFIKMMKKEFDI